VAVVFVCGNHSTIRIFCSVVIGEAILNDVTGASVAKYGKKYWCMTISALTLTSSCVLSLSCIVQPKLTETPCRMSGVRNVGDKMVHFLYIRFYNRKAILVCMPYFT
jgi:hypothetical protein